MVEVLESSNTNRSRNSCFVKYLFGMKIGESHYSGKKNTAKHEKNTAKHEKNTKI